MNKIKTILSVLSIMFLSTAANAGAKIGLNAAYTMFSTSGSETLRQSSNVTNKTVDEDVIVPSLFLEVTNENGLGIGVDYVPVAELGNGKGDDDDAETSGANKASAELASHITLYALKSFGDSGMFVKGGISFADVDTTETLATGDSYGNSDTTGLMIGIGKEFDLQNFFGRASLSYTDYDDVSITSTGGSKVKADVDSTALTFSIGKEF
jgi:hypothetical protein